MDINQNGGAASGAVGAPDMSVFDMPTPGGAPPQNGAGSPPAATGIISIDPDFAGLPKEEAIHRTWQRRYDKDTASLKKFETEAGQNLTYRQMLEEISSDDEALVAFLNERKPEFLPKRDLSAAISEALKKEFGDYTPTADEPRNPGSKAWLYDKKANDVYAQLSQGGKQFGSLKELREARQKQAEQQSEANRAEIEAVAKEYQWSPEQTKAFAKWAAELSAKDIAKMYRFALRTGTAGTPGVAAAASAEATGMSQSRADFLKTL